MSGRHVLITGAGRGIGMCSARLLAYLGATVHIADINPTNDALARIRQDVPWADVRATPRLDLGCQASTKQFAQWVTDSGLPISILINNAGANFMGVEPWYTDQGVAGLAQVNFLGPYTLTRLLQDVLLASSSQPRVVNVASVMHRFTSLPSDPKSFLTDWWKGGSYRACKHALVGFTALLQRELGPAGMVAVSVDPGAVYSGIWANSRILGKPPGSTIIRALFSSTEDACATTLHAAAAPDVQPGAYYARGLFASRLLTEMPYEPWAGLLSVLDAPLRTASGGRLCAELAAAPVAPRARDLAPFEALWDACADLAELPRETRLLPELLAARRARGWQAPGAGAATPAMTTEPAGVTADRRR